MNVVGVWACEYDNCGVTEALVADNGEVYAVLADPEGPDRCDCWTGAAGFVCGHLAAVTAVLAAGGVR